MLLFTSEVLLYRLIISLADNTGGVANFSQRFPQIQNLVAGPRLRLRGENKMN